MNSTLISRAMAFKAFFFAVVALSSLSTLADEPVAEASPALVPTPELQARIERLKWESLLEAFPDVLTIEDAQKKILKVKNGSRYVFNEFPSQRSTVERMETPDLEDTFFDVYPPTCNPDFVPSKDFDPGRYRVQGFFKDLYGHTERDIESSIVRQNWINGQMIRVNKKHNVHTRLSRIANLVDRAPLDLFTKYLWPSEGAFNFRFIAGTKHLSSHSFGTAIDVNLKFSNYWKWEEPNPEAPFKYKNSIPCEVIGAFENENFVSGAKWYHYDTMHFEYRPELILFSKKLVSEFGNDLSILRDFESIRVH